MKKQLKPISKSKSKVVKKVVKKITKEPKKPSEASAVPLAQVMQGRLNFAIPGIKKNDARAITQKRLLIFTPTVGNVRMEWVQARYSQMIPTNWSFADMLQFLSSSIPIDYQLADAQNLVAKKVVEDDYEWLLMIEDDNVLPPDAFIRINEYMNRGDIPMVSGLYFLKSTHAEPLVYRGRGNSHFQDWKLGDRVWVDGMPMGFLLIHSSLIKAAWKESEEYQVMGETTRRVFEQPNSMWLDEETGGIIAKGGTTDLQWCSRLMEDGLFTKAGWPKFQKMKYPFLVDTRIFIKHIDRNSGVMWPVAVPARFIPDSKDYKGKEVT